MLTLHELILIGVVLAALALIVSNRLRPDVVALLVLLTLAISGVDNPQEALSGFSRSAVIVIMSMFVLTEALEQTGVIQSFAARIRRLGGGSERRLVVIFMSAGAFLSLFMNNIAAGAVPLPAAVQVARETGVRPSKLLIPLSFGSLVGGMATYFTTANIVLSGILQERGFNGLGMLDFLPTGGLIVLAALAYMALVGRRLLPDRESLVASVNPAGLARNLREAYQLDERLWEVRVPPGSRLVNNNLANSHIGRELGITVVAIWRNHHAILAPAPTEVIAANDYLLLLGQEDRVHRLADWGVSVGRENGNKPLQHHDYSVDLTEVVIPPRSNVVGKTLKDMNFRARYNLTAVALWREGRSYRTDVGLQQLQVGDALLMVGPIRAIKSLAEDRDFLVLQSSHVYRPPVPHKAKWALLIAVLVLLASIFEVVPIATAMLAGAVAVVLAGCLSMDDAYRAVEWRVVFLIAGMLPISIAMVNTGLAGRIGDSLVQVLAPFGPLAVIAGLFLLTVLVVQVMAGQVAALIIGPIAVSAAVQVGLRPDAVAVAVSIACSAAFISPLGHPVNILMMGPGGYTFRDFVKVGVGMTFISLVMMLVGMVLFWDIRG